MRCEQMIVLALLLVANGLTNAVLTDFHPPRTCEYCQQDSDCVHQANDHSKRCHRVQSFNPLISELVTTLGKNSAGQSVEAAYCIEKDLFDPFTFNDVLATIIAFLSTALGSGCGIGGGGLLVPGFITVIGLSPKHAIPLSKATIFGNAMAIYFFNFYRKHPSTSATACAYWNTSTVTHSLSVSAIMPSTAKKNVPIINYAVSAIMEPMTLIGAIFGVMLNHIFPDWLILALLISLLSFITYKTYQKGNKVRVRHNCCTRML
jgi:hypothetical protein